MATVWLKRRGWEEGEVPDVCMQCGREAPDRVAKTFTWMPNWIFLFLLLGGIGVIVTVIVALSLRQQRRAVVPLCEKHVNHWRWRSRVAWATLVLFLAANGMFALAVSFLGNPDDRVLLVCAGLLLSFLVWVVVVAIVYSGAIKAMEFSKRAIRLAKVSREFVEAYEDQLDREERWRYGDPDLIDRTVRERWNQRPQGPASNELREHVREESPEEDYPSDRYRPG